MTSKLEPMYPVYVIEGPDCSGKTTFANELAKVTGATRVHLTYRFKDRMDLYHRAAFDKVHRMRATQPVILDRWWPSEIVYARAFRGRTSWPMNARHFDRMARQHGFHYVFCLPLNRAQYVESWMEERERRYAEKPWALRGRSEKNDDQGRVYDLYRSTLMWMDAANRRDVTLYDRFQYPGHEVERAIWLLRKRTGYRDHEPHDRWIEERYMHAQLLLHPRLEQLGRAGHASYPGAQWNEVQRDLDTFAEQNGVPDHLLDFGCPRDRDGNPYLGAGDVVTNVYRKPAIAMAWKPEDYADLMNALGDWEDVVHRVLPYRIGLGALKALGKKEVRNAAHRLGLV